MPTPPPRADAEGHWARRLMPSFFDLIVVSLPLWFFGLADGGTGLLLSDGDTGWHIRTGEWILHHHSFVYGDPFSFTMPGQPWFAWEWLSDIILGGLHMVGGMPAVVLLGMVVAAAFCGLIFRQMTANGANVFIALPLALMSFGAATVHLLARPHLFTMLLTAVSVWMITADLKQQSRWLWALIPLGVVWTNLHGGWLALVALAGLAGAGCAVEALLGRREWSAAIRYVTLAVAVAAGSLVNPYGWHLHAHMAEYLRADWIKEVVSEFRSPTFRGEAMMQYEALLLLALLACGAVLAKGRVAVPLMVAFWAHQSLVSARHIPLFVAVAAPLLASELQELWNHFAAGRDQRSVAGILNALAEEARPSLQRTTFWVVVPFVLIWLRVIPIPWREDFPDERFPVKMVARHTEMLAGARVYTVDQWSDYLIYRCYPQYRSFFDGRSDFYGEKLTREYMRLMGADHDWKQLLEKYGFENVLVPPKWALASVLKESPGWRVVDDDGKAILFRRVDLAQTGTNEK